MTVPSDSPIARDGKSIILAHDHGLEHGPAAFSGVEDRLDPTTVFDMATHDAVTAFAVQKGLAEQYYPSYDDQVNLLAKCNGSSSLWMGEPYSPRDDRVRDADRPGTRRRSGQGEVPAQRRGHGVGRRRGG